MQHSRFTPFAALLFASSSVLASDTKLTPASSHSVSNAGRSVSLRNGLALVGAPNTTVGLIYPGDATLFDADPTSVDFGSEILSLSPPDGADEDIFGVSVGLSNGVALVGAALHSGGGFSTGAAYIFDIDPSSPDYGTVMEKLIASDAASGDYFGWNLAVGEGWSGAMDNGFALIASERDTNAGGVYAGAVYVFDANRFSSTFGMELGKLMADDGDSYDHFGWSVAISGDLALVGAWGDDDLGSDAGAAYLFDLAPGSGFGTQLLKLTASDGDAGDGFGAVSIDGGLAIIGSGADDDRGLNSGSLYVFDVDPSSLTFGDMLGKLTDPDGQPGDYFGAILSLQDGRALVGTASDDDLATNAGSASLYNVDPSSTGWWGFGSQLSKWTASDGAAGDQLGFCVSLDGDQALVGAPLHDANSMDRGSAYLLDTTDICQIQNVCVTSPNSVGPGAVLSHTGTCSHAANNLGLVASECPPLQFGVFFYGSMAQMPTPFGNGYLCVYGHFSRFPPIQINTVGVATWALDNLNPPSSLGQISPGDTKWFQFWYRDPLGGGARYNLSDALRVTFGD